MRITAVIIFIAITAAACDSEQHTCTCKKDGEEVATYDLNMNKKEAGFECQQKNLRYSGKPEFEGTKCQLQ